jgi:hypothetical protein
MLGAPGGCPEPPGQRPHKCYDSSTGSEAQPAGHGQGCAGTPPSHEENNGLMVTAKKGIEARAIKQMIEEIKATPTGGEAVEQLQRRRYRVRFGRPLGGGAFTYPWKAIRVRRGHAYWQTRSMLIHEVGHTAFSSLHGKPWAASIEQEYEASRFWAQVNRELDALPEHLAGKWFGPEHDISAAYEEIRNSSLWHRIALPRHQPRGFRDKLWAVWQAILALMWLFGK